jgi:hypothetical protein
MEDHILNSKRIIIRYYQERSKKEGADG